MEIKSPQPSRVNVTGTRNAEDIHIAILTQTESQQTGLSTIQITIDGHAPEIENIAVDSTAELFVQLSTDTYKATQVNISKFISILIGIKQKNWTLMGTNAFLNNAKQEVVKTFYFEKVNGRTSSSGNGSVVRTATNSGVPSKKSGTHVTTPINVNVSDGLGSPGPKHGDVIMTRDRQLSVEGKTRDRQLSVEGKSSVENVEQRIAAITAAQNARKSFLVQQQSQQQQQGTRQSPFSPSPSSSSSHDDDDNAAPVQLNEQSSNSPLGLLGGLAPRVKTTTPGTATAAAASDMQKKNAEYFKRMKKEQDVEKKKQEEEEAKLDEGELRRRKEQQALQEAHESSKTAHFSRLGATFVTGGGLFGVKKPAL